MKMFSSVVIFRVIMTVLSRRSSRCLSGVE